ncbi:MFS-type transporter clz9-like [Vanessa cardui]|uniref:MFS-type transporter clz9-like n=1 Tax=Vanessa cardui TaxID=171605 RepID=UPI001F1380B0|nr:MFS-type transporter clz9-like [Vanessa cardui]
MAGKAWFYKFMKRHPQLSVRQPENTSLNRIKGLNKENVFHFFDLLEKIIDENGIEPTNIFNVDESGFSTVQKKAQKIVRLKGKKQIGAATSGERGVNTTAVCCASVSGQFIPPINLIKRMRQNPELANGAPLGSVVTVSESGYINSALFVEWLKHFIKIVKPTLENKVLLLLDGHTTHSKNFEALCLARDNGIILLQLPGHTTNRIQPLDVSFFKPLSTYYIQSTEKWLRTNPGRQVTQYQVAQLFGEAYERAAVIGNIVNGFRASGIWPTNRHIFPEHVFEAADNLLTAETANSSNESVSILQNLTEFEKEDNFKKRKEVEGNDDKEKCNQEKGNNEKKKQDRELLNSQPSTSKVKDIQLKTTPADIKKTIKVLSPLPKTTMKKKNTIQKAIEITPSPYKNQLEDKIKQKKDKVKKEKSLWDVICI